MLSISKRSLIVLLSVVVLLLGATQAFANELQFNMTEGVTSVSKEVYSLHMTIFYICCVIGVIVFSVMFYSMFVHRKSRGAKASNFHESVTLELLWTVVPAIILVVMAWPATLTLKKIYDTSDAELDILITGLQWKWKYEYLGEDVSFFSNMSTPREQIENKQEKGEHYLLEVDEPLVIPAGIKVRFLVTASDVIHSWWVPDLSVKRDAIPGYINEAWTLVDEPGVYRGQCTELCGKDHGFMPIEVHVLPQEEYQAWLGEKREAARLVAEAAKQTLSFEELFEQGEQVYDKFCVACHQANGEGVPGVFPAIVGSPIAMGPISEHLNRVVNGGQGMPAFGEQLTPVEAAAVITFQRNAYGNNMGDEIQPIDVVKYKQGE